jgi:hypothetical protein
LLSRFLLVAALSAANRQGGVLSLSSQEKSAVAISVNVPFVVLHATVRDREGQFVWTLQKQDFRV